MNNLTDTCSSDSDDSEHNDESNSNSTTTTTTTLSHEVLDVFKHHVLEPKNNCVLFQVRKTIRERIFPFMKFCNESVLRMVKLREENNILHLLLSDVNRLDDSDVNRAKFWLTYKREVPTVITIRKTEVSNGIKEVVFNGKML